MLTMDILDKQKEYFASGETHSVSFRKQMLKRLYSAVKKHEDDICKALYADLGKSRYEAFMCEIGIALTEISYMIKHLGRFAKEKRVKTPLAQFPSRSYKKPVPYGNILIMSPWNYPFLLSVEPLANAIAAGNTAIIKPSAYSPATSELLKKIISDTFPENYVAVVTGGRKENSELLSMPFDLVFFTGSKNVGKEVLKSCAERLTPAVLELGGKSPCIVDNTANLQLAAKRIVFGKFLNCGQTCVAPDYLLCDESIKERLVAEIIKQIKLQYGEFPLECNEYGRIVNEKHFERLLSLIDDKKTVYGGGFDKEKLRIEPTVLDGVLWDDAIMQEEIFGPILPILTYTRFDEIIPIINGRDKPLALYIFSENKRNVAEITQKCLYGGGCVNDCIIHLATCEMGFGGVHESGMGAYHGKTGFDTFSHTKSIVDKSTRLDLPMRYRHNRLPFYEKLLRIFLK